MQQPQALQVATRKEVCISVSTRRNVDVDAMLPRLGRWLAAHAWAYINACMVVNHASNTWVVGHLGPMLEYCMGYILLCLHNAGVVHDTAVPDLLLGFMQLAGCLNPR